MGEDGQLCVVLLGWAALLSWHNLGQIVSGWWSSRQQRCKDACGGTESCGEDCIRLCVLCTQSALGRTGFRRHRRRDRRACCRCGRPGLSRAQEGQSKIFEDGKCVGSGGDCGKQRVIAASTLHYYLDIAIVCCWAGCGLSTCAIYRQGSTWTNTAPTRFNAGLLVEAGDGGGGALVPGSGSWTLFIYFFGAVGEGNIEVKVQEAGTVLLILGTMLGGGTLCSDTRRTPFPLLVAAGLQWKGKKGLTDCDVWRFSHRP